VTDRQFAHGEVPNRSQRAKRSQNGNSTFHVYPRGTDFKNRIPVCETLRSLVLNIGHGDVTGRLNVVN
jgi:hypothetical protein